MSEGLSLSFPSGLGKGAKQHANQQCEQGFSVFGTIYNQFWMLPNCILINRYIIYWLDDITWHIFTKFLRWKTQVYDCSVYNAYVLFHSYIQQIPKNSNLIFTVYRVCTSWICMSYRPKVKPVAQIVQQPTRRAPLDVVLVTPISGHWSVAFRALGGAMALF